MDFPNHTLLELPLFRTCNAYMDYDYVAFSFACVYIQINQCISFPSYPGCDASRDELCIMYDVWRMMYALDYKLRVIQECLAYVWLCIVFARTFVQMLCKILHVLHLDMSH